MHIYKMVIYNYLSKCITYYTNSNPHPQEYYLQEMYIMCLFSETCLWRKLRIFTTGPGYINLFCKKIMYYTNIFIVLHTTSWGTPFLSCMEIIYSKEGGKIWWSVDIHVYIQSDKTETTLFQGWISEYNGIITLDGIPWSISWGFQ
jgi:hypothetical protein